ncbi:uncharacterized protein LOC116778474 [Danaus plexippus]|uniref:uncharacterized protein LOC116778474 n=1 Tax=Danaus plexippus TaxID=13037 RepID=UPI002AAF0B1B|nr:uncharacterized protein LOC116778474 [Danaus plexippus]
MRFYLTYRNHGLYDPVLDDTEVIYVPIDPDELGNVNGQENIQREKKEIIECYQTDLGTRVQPVDRLSIEPDVGNLPLLVNLDEIPPEGKFKLPISEQYDPDGKRVRLCRINGKKAVRFDLKQIIKEDFGENDISEKIHNIISDFTTESKLDQERAMKQDPCISFEQNEATYLKVIKERALEIVSDSINRAVTVASEAKENIKNELLSEKNNLSVSNVIKDFDVKFNEVNIQKESIEEQYKVNVSDEIKKFENIDSRIERSVEERQLRTKQDIQEAIESGTVNRRSEAFKKENIELNEPVKVYKKSSVISKAINKDENFKDSEAKRRVFSIGLQTIPNIKEKVDAMHVNSRLKLLTTFFLQLTNIMIALSKIILKQPVTYVTQTEYTKSKQKDVAKEDREDRDNKSWESYNDEGQGLSKYKYDYDSHVSEGELIRKGKLTGAKIAQIEGGLPADLTDKMDLVISEFQKRTGCEEHTRDEFEQVFRTHSESRSKTRGDDSFYSGTRSDTDTGRRKVVEDFVETKTQSYEIKEIKSEKRTSESISRTESKPYVYETKVEGDNLTYVAIVESHVYTNKDAIFEEKVITDSSTKSERLETETLELDRIIKDTTTSSLEKTILIPETKEVTLKEKYEETSDIQKIETGLEEASIKVAAKKISEVLEPFVQIAANKSYAKEAQTIVEPFNLVVQSNDVTTEEFKQYFVATTLMSQKIYPSLEQPTKSVVEITEIITDENANQGVHVTDLIEERSTVQIEDTRSIAEITEISLTEDQKESKTDIEVIKIAEKNADIKFTELKAIENSVVDFQEPTHTIETPKTEEKQPIIEVENKYLTVPETFTVLPEEPKQLIEETQIKTQQVHVGVNELGAVETIITSSVEPQFKSLEVPPIVEKQPIATISTAPLTVAEIMTVLPDEPKDETFYVPKITEITPSVDFEANRAIETTTVCLEETIANNLEFVKLAEEQSGRGNEVPSLVLAEVCSIISEEPREEFEISDIKNEKAEIKVLDFKAAETMIVEPEEGEQNEIILKEPIGFQPNPSIEPPSLMVVEVTTMLPEEMKGALNVPEVKTQQAEVKILNLKAAETLVVNSEESKQTAFKPEQLVTEHPKTNIELSNLTVPEILATTTVETSNEIVDSLETTKILKNEQQISMEGIALKVAEVTTVVPSGPKDKPLEIPKITECKPSIDIIGIRSAETIMIQAQEPKCEKLDDFKVEEKQGITSSEEPHLTVAQVISTIPDEGKGDLNVPELKTLEAELKIVDLKVAETTVVQPEESKQVEIKSEQLAERRTKTNIESINLSVPETLATTIVESSKSLVVPSISKNDQKVLTEEVLLTVAETTAIVPSGPKDEILEVAKIEECKPSLDVVDIKAVETILVQSEEPKFSNLECEKLDEKRSVTSVVTPYLTIAQVESTTTGEAKAELEVPVLINHKANISILELKAADSFVVQPEESKQPELNLEKVNKQESIANVEPSNLGVAEILTTNISESSKHISEVEKIKNQQAHVEVTEYKAIETTEVALADLTYQKITIPDTETKQIKTAMEETVQSVAQKTEVHLTEAGIPIPIAPKVPRKEANIKFSSIKPIEQETITTLEVTEGDIREKTESVSRAASLKVVEATAASVEQTTAVLEATKHTVTESEIQVKEKQSQTLIEKPTLAVAETITILPQESRNEFEVKATKNQKAKIGVSEFKTAEVSLVSSEEAKESQLKLKSLDEKKSRESIELSRLSVAEVSATTVTESSKNILEARRTKNQQASFTFEEHKAVETEETFKDMSCKTLTLQGPEERQTQTKLEQTAQSVAQVTEVHVNEAENKIFELKDKAMEASLVLKAITPLEQESVITLEVVENDTQKSKQLSNKANVAIIESTATAVQEVLAVAEVKKENFEYKESNVQANLGIEKLKRREAEIKEVNLHQNFKLSKHKYRNEHVKPTTPATPVIEEYMFSLEAELEHPYIIGPGVSEDALFKIKAQRNQIESADTSYTLAIESTIDADSEDIEEIEEVENLYLDKKLIEIQDTSVNTSETQRTKASTHIGLVSQDISADTQNLNVNRKILKQRQAAMQEKSLANGTSHKRVRFGINELGVSSETNQSSVEIAQDLSAAALSNEASYKLSLKKAMAGKQSVMSHSENKSLQASNVVTGMSSKIKTSSIEIAQDLDAEAISNEASFQLSLKKAMAAEESINQSKQKSLQSGFVAGASTDINVTLTSPQLSAEASGHDASYKLSIQHSADGHMEEKAMFNQGLTQVTSQSSSSGTKQVKSSKSIKSAQKQDSSLQMALADSSEASMQRKEQASYSSRLNQSSAEEIFSTETYQHLDLGLHDSELHVAADASLEAYEESGAMQYSAEIIEDVSKKSLLRDKLTLRTDIEGAITNGSISSPPLVPPTPLTDEYVFRLETDMPEESPFIQRDCSISPDSMHEEIIVNGLIPHYKTIVGRRVVYSPPLPTPPTSPDKTKPAYSKPGLKGGSNTLEMTETDILECQRNKKLVRAIDRTLRQIEEYKASVGMTDEIFSNKEVKDKTISSEEKREEYIDKEITPIYIVEEIKEKNREVVDVSVKVNNLTEHNGDRETVTVVTDDEEGNEAREEELTVLEPGMWSEVSCEESPEKYSDSEIIEKEHREQTAADLTEATMLPDKQIIGVTSGTSEINKIISKTRFLQF